MESAYSCSRCQFEISEERLSDTVVVCESCGHTESNNQTAHEEKETKKFIMFIVVGGITLSLGIISLFKWQDYVFTAGSINLKSGVGLASNDELKDLSKICVELKDADCVEEVHRTIASSEEVESDDIREYGHVLFLREKYVESLEVYDSYFKKGGENSDAQFDYARLLSRAGRNDEANTYFLKVINSKPDIMQHTVAAAYVEHLIQVNDIIKAKKFISSWRSKGTNASHFLETQLQKIKKLESSKT